MRFMPNMALTRRGFIVESRRLSTYAVRFMMAMVTLFALIIHHDQYRYASLRVSAIGREFFMVITYINLAFVTGAAISFFASAVTEEKEDGALPLLVMTGLGPLTMLTSKFLSRFATGVSLLLCQVPFTVLAVTLGGITLRQIAATYLTIFAYLVFLCAMALFFSTVSPRMRVASALAFFGMTLFYTLPLIVFLAANFILWAASGFAGLMPENSKYMFEEWYELTPFLRVDQVLSTASTFTLVGIQFWSNLAFGSALFALSLLFFNWGARQNPEGWGARGAWARKKRFLRWFAPGRVGKWAIQWKEFHFATGGKLGIALRFGLYGILFFLATCVEESPAYRARNASGFILMTGLWAGAIELTAIAQTVFATEIQRKTFQSLCGLPCSLGRVAYAKLFGASLSLIPVILYVASGFLLHPPHFFEMFESEFEGFIAAAAIFLFYLHLVTHLSLWLRHGAFLVAGMMCVMFFVLFMLVFGRLFHIGDSFGVAICFCAVVSTFYLHAQIAAKLARLRGRD